MSDTGEEAPSTIDAAWVRARLDRLWPVHNAALADLLICLRRQFDGDLDAMLVLLVIAIGARAENWEARLLGRSERPAAQRPVNTQSIADISGIPRESVRRKLVALADRGWIVREMGGCWRLGEAVAGDLRPSTQAAIDYFVRIFSAAGLAERGS